MKKLIIIIIVLTSILSCLSAQTCINATDTDTHSYHEYKEGYAILDIKEGLEITDGLSTISIHSFVDENWQIADWWWNGKKLIITTIIDDELAVLAKIKNVASYFSGANGFKITYTKTGKALEKEFLFQIHID